MRALLGMLLVVVACESAPPPATPSPASAVTVTPADAPPPIPDGLPVTVYRRALAQAHKEINADNARDHLAELERRIDLELQSLD